MRPDQRGWLFNNEQDQFSLSSIFGFDMTRVLDDPVIRTAALMYIFHRTDELLTGEPVMIFLDEGWRLLDDDVFAFFIRDKLKTIRKQNGIIGFGTQSAADIVRSNSANTLIEQTSTNMFFPNPKADDESYAGVSPLRARGDWIRSTVPESRSFLIKHGRDSVIARLQPRRHARSDQGPVGPHRDRRRARRACARASATTRRCGCPIFLGKAP